MGGGAGVGCRSGCGVWEAGANAAGASDGGAVSAVWSVIELVEALLVEGVVFSLRVWDRLGLLPEFGVLDD